MTAPGREPRATSGARSAGPAGPAGRPTRLSEVLPAVAASLGVTSGGVTLSEATEEGASGPPAGLPAARRSVVVLLDGLGQNQLQRRGGHAPFLRTLQADGMTLDCGYPSTTATSMGSFGTGTPAGRHGLVGYEVLDPETDRVFNELSWEQGPDPRRWQPLPTVFEMVQADGVAVTRVGPGFFDGSGLTNAALRGGRFVAANRLSDRVDAAVEAVRAADRSLVYLYWGDIDKIGHTFGAGSWQWGEQLELVDGELSRLARAVPSDTSVHITADHGMLDVPDDRRVDLVDEPDLLVGVRHVAGEPRAVQLHCEPGAAEQVAQRWRQRFAGDVQVALRDDAVRDGRFGPVQPRVLPRIGDVLVDALSDLAIFDSSRMRPELLALRGFHGSVTAEETLIPLLTVPPRQAP